MSSPNPLLGIFSYAHEDWKADKEELGDLFTQLEAQIRVRYTDRDFERWRDQERLVWGEPWREGLHAAIGAAELFFLFLSPRWLVSPVCREELEAFLDRQRELGAPRVVVAQIRPISDEQGLAHAPLLEHLRSLHILDFQHALEGGPEIRKQACRQAAEHVAELLSRTAEAAARTRQAAAVKLSAPARTCADKLVSGDFHIPPANQRGEGSERVTAWLRLLFAGWARVRTRKGTFVFGAHTARLRVDVTGGRLFSHPEFGATGPNDVIPVEGQSAYSKWAINSPSTDQVLYGNVLSARDEHVPIVEIERHAGKEVAIAGTVDLEVECVLIDDGRSEPKCQGREKLDDMHRTFARLILEEHGKSLILEPARG